MSNGYNPMKWNCGTRGCFNAIRRPKIEVFAEVLPGRIAMSDIDATVEVNGNFLFMEFKSHLGDIPTGQKIYFQRLTRLSSKITVLVICADAETMMCHALRLIYGGEVFDWEAASLEDVMEELRQWTIWALKPAPFGILRP
jgi:hypothetical protein